MGLLAVAAGDYRAAMLWMLLTLVIDGIDGTFARAARVREVLPQVNGSTIDYVIDFFTYAILPAYFFYRALPVGSETLHLAGAFIMLLSAALYYGKEGMVSEDGKHFIGFPVLWNMVVFVQIFVFTGWPAWAHLLFVVALAVLHFLPIYFVYPSRGGRWWPVTIANTVLFIVAVAVNAWYYPEWEGGAAVFWRGMVYLTVGYYVVLAYLDTPRVRKKY